MTPVPTALVLAGGSWIGLHVGVAGTALRGVVARRTGENGFRILFSTLSVATIAFLVISYRNARAQGSPTLWTTPHWLGWLLVLLMAPAFVLLVGSMTRPNPTAIGGEKLAGQEPRGLSRITRHPMLWSFATWSVVHVIGNGDLVSLLFFGTFGVTALLGMPSIDHKLAARDPAAWRTLASTTSILPFGAILAGRNRLVLSEIGWIAPVVGLVLWVLLVLVHPWLFGVSPLPS